MHASRTAARLGLLTALVLLFLLVSCSPGEQPDETPPAPESERLTRDAAVELLLEQVILPDLVDTPLIAFGLKELLPAGAEVAPYAPVDLPQDISELPFLVPRTLERETWFFWVDDVPFAQFSHPTRYVFIDAETGVVEVQEEAWWPYIDGEPVEAWIGPGRWDPQNWDFSTVDADEIPEQTGLPAVRRTPHDVVIAHAVAPAARLSGEAIVAVNGWAEGHGTDAGFTGDMLQARAFARASGIPIYEPTGNQLADIEASIRQAVNDGAVDIFFYFTGHGGRGTDGLFWRPFRGTVVIPENLIEIFDKFAPSVKFKVVIQGCYSGGWVQPLQDSGLADIVISSSAADELSYGDWDPGGVNADPNPGDVGSEFSSGLWEDLGEILEDKAQQGEAQRIARLHNRSEFVGWLILANVSAAQKDATFKAGRTSPQLWVSDDPPTKQTAHAEASAALDAAGGDSVWLPTPVDVGSVAPNGQFTSTSLPPDHPLETIEPILVVDGEDQLYIGTLGAVDDLSINVSVFQEGDPAFVPSTTLTFDSGSPEAPLRPAYEVNPIFPGDPGVCVRDGAVLFPMGISLSSLDRIRAGSIWIYVLRPDAGFDLNHYTFGPDTINGLERLRDLAPGGTLATPLPPDLGPESIPIFSGAGEDELSLGLFADSPFLEVMDLGDCIDELLPFETSP